MSIDEQESARLRLYDARVEHGKQIALLRGNIAAMADLCGSIHASIRANPPILDAVFAKTDQIKRLGGLEKLPEWILELRNRNQALSEINGLLEDAGLR